MRNTLITLTLLFAFGGCDDAAKTDPKADPKAKTTTAKKELKIPAKKDGKSDGPADAKPDTKSDAKADTKADAKPDTAEPAADTPPDAAEGIAKLAALAKEIAAKPDAADAILEKAGMDRLAFEAAMVDVAKDQWKTDLYLAALTQPS